MWIRSLQADRLRNLKTIEMELVGGLTVLVGPNGQGKTSLLEGLYLLSTGRSFRTRQLEEVVSRDGGPLRISGPVASRTGESRLGVVIDAGARQLIADGIERPIEAYLGRLDVVALHGGSADVLRGPAAERRRFLDQGIVALDPSAVKDLAEYRRVLAQRNALLKRMTGREGSAAGRELGAWDARLADAAGRVHRRRREFAVRLGSHLGESCRALFPEGWEVLVHYRPSPAAQDSQEASSYEERLLGSLRRSGERDRTLGFTAVGPHRDELTVGLEGAEARRYGSSGQVRAVMVALSVAKQRLLTEERGETPVFVMDDFDSDLDDGRVSALAALLAGGGGQAVLATSREGIPERLGVPHRKIRIEGGRAHVA